MTKNEAALPEGYTSRPANLEDANAVVDLINAFTNHHAGITPATTQNLRNDWVSPGYDQTNDTLLVCNERGKAVGYADCWDVIDPPVHPYVSLCVHPDFEERGVGDHLLAWIDKRGRQALSRAEQDLQVALQIGFYSTAESMKTLAESNGYRLIRHAFRMQIDMDAPPPAPVWPDGITLKPFDPDADIEMVYRADDEAFSDHFGYVEPADHQLALEDFEHYMTGRDSYEPALWFLAMDGDQLAGICLCARWSKEDKDCGHVSSLGVLKPWRKRGLGLALLRHAFGEYYRRGYRKVSLGVDAQNLTGALRLYKKAGMYVKRQYDNYEKILRPGRQISVQSLE